MPRPISARLVGMRLETGLSPIRRAARLLRLLREPQTLEALQAQLGVTERQVRRDLDDLEAEGWLIRRQSRPRLVWLETVQR